MRTAAILIIFLVRCVYLHPTEIKSIIDGALNQSCIFGPKSMEVIFFSSDIPEGKNIKEQEACPLITDRSKPIYVVVHGFISYANTTNGYDFASKFVKKNSTVLLLDWSTAACKNGIPLLKLLAYPQAVENTRAIGKLMARYVVSLVKDCNIPLDNITFIGHSLGAHVCSFAAKDIQKSISRKVNTIIAADPAKPLFERCNCTQRLCKSDAIHIIVLHTSPLGFAKACESLLSLTCNISISHIVLQFNGGEHQPDCVLGNIPCDHTESFAYLSDISNKCIFPGVKKKPDNILESIFGSPSYPGPNTTDCIVVNNQIFNIKRSDKLKEGEYYVFVKEKPPYCTEESFSCSSLIIPTK